jgi:drug/metabolite transporter superfamily protein YnfA
VQTHSAFSFRILLKIVVRCDDALGDMNHPAIAWKSHFAAVTALLVALAPAMAQPSQQAYVKPSNTGALYYFGRSVSVAGDTAVVGATGDNSNATGVNGSQLPNGAGLSSGAAYVFKRVGGTWIHEAYLKASNTGLLDQFGFAVAISGDTIVVSAMGEDSGATGVNGNGADNSGINPGAAYVFVRDGTNWTQQAYLKASNAGISGAFGISVAIASDIIVIGANQERSGATGVNGDQYDTNAPNSGAAYVFVRHGTNWTQQAYLKASDTHPNDRFGESVAVSGETVVVGAPIQAPIQGYSSGAAYVFVRVGTNWSQQAFLKAAVPDTSDMFGHSVAISGDTIVASAHWEDSNAVGVNGDQNDNSSTYAGAAYVFVRQGTNWSQQAYLKASNTGTNDYFGTSVAISGHTIVVGAAAEDSAATGANGDWSDNSRTDSGAAYVFTRQDNNWMQQAYLKASNTDAYDQFGGGVAISGDTVVIGALYERSIAVGINGDQTNNSVSAAGAAYIFRSAGLDLRLIAAPSTTNGFVLVTNTAPGLSYTLERTSNIDAPWESVETLKATLPHSLLFHDTNAPSGQTFYRAAQQ